MQNGFLCLLSNERKIDGTVGSGVVKMAVKFATIASGSSGNSIFIGTEYTKILIDAGLSGKKIQAGLSDIGVTGDEIDGIFVTHEHIDHIHGIGILSRRFNIPIYATEGTWKYMPSSVGKIKPENKIVISKEKDFTFKDLNIKPYAIPHDAAEPVGYSVMTDKFKISVATDIGHVTEEIMDNIKDCDLLLLESNHDIDMLKSGTYPYQLKKRILGENGHLSNDTAGKLLAWVICQNSKLKNVFLGHLSKENNTPLTAFETVRGILDGYDIEIGKEFNLYLAARDKVEKLIELA